MTFSAIRYETDGRIAHITLNRPERLNAISAGMPAEIAAAVALANTQMIATLFDAITRHSPEGMWFKEYAQADGFAAAVEWRDSGRNIPQGRDRNT